MPAVSVRRMRGPSRRPWKPAARSSCAVARRPAAFRADRKHAAAGRRAAAWPAIDCVASGSSRKRARRGQRPPATPASDCGARDRRHARAPALLAGRDHHAAPVRQALVGALGVELHFAALADHRHDRRRRPSSVAFCRIQSIFSPRAMPCSSVMRSGDSLSTARARRAISTSTLALADARDARVVVVAVAVEQHAGIADAAGAARAPGARPRPRAARRVAPVASGGIDDGRGSRASGDGLVDGGARWSSRQQLQAASSSMQYGGIQYSMSPSGRSTTPRSSAAR